MAKEECYGFFNSRGLAYGPSFQAIQELYYHKGEVLGVLELPKALAGGLGEYVLHPSLMDGALQSIMGFMVESGDGSTYVPYSVREVCILRPLVGHCYAYGRKEDGEKEGSQRFSIDVIDEDGNVLVQLKDFIARNYNITLSADIEKSVYPEQELIFLEEAWVEHELTEEPSLEGDILLFDSERQMHKMLSLEISARIIRIEFGVEYGRTEEGVYVVRRDEAGDYELLLKALLEEGVKPKQVVFFFRREEFGEGVDTEDSLGRTVYTLYHFTRALMRSRYREEVRTVCLKSGFEPSPVISGLQGFCKSIHLENPKYRYKFLEMESAVSEEEVLGRLMAEFSSWGERGDVRYEGKSRCEHILKDSKWSGGSGKDLPLKEGGVYLVTGGMGGLGLIFAKYLAGRYHAKLLLSGRRELDAKIEALLNELKDLGGDARYVRCDVTKLHDVQALIKAGREGFGRIDGVIHGAGLLRDALLVQKSFEDIEAVIKPKVYGAINLDLATCEEGLDFFVLFSSVAGVVGNIGQTDYAYGNSFLDGFSGWREQERAGGRRKGRTLSIDWPLWAEGGMHVDEETRKWMWEKMGMGVLPTVEGLKAFERSLGGDRSQYLIFYGNRKVIEERVLRVEQEEGAKEERDVTAGDPEKILKAVEDYLKGVFSEETRLPVGRIKSGEPLERYGIDSVMIVRLNRRLEEIFGALSKTLFFEYQTIAELAKYFAGNHYAQLSKEFGIAEERLDVERTALKVVSDVVPVKRARARFLGQVERHSDKVTDEPIAIIGLSGRYPMARNLEEYWQNLKSGRDCISEIPRERFDWHEYYDSDRSKKGKIFCKWGGFIEDVDKFDPLFFNMSPLEAELIDPQERLFLEEVWHTIEDAGYKRSLLWGRKIGVFVGVMWGEYQFFGAQESLKGHHIASTSSYASIANRISYYFNFTGPSIGLDTMCSSSLTSIHLACESIRRGESDLAIAGGVNISVHPNKYFYLSQSQFISSDGRCRSFGEGGDGYVPGEGVGAVLLKPLKQAVSDGDHIYGVILGSAVNHGGKTNGYTVPNPNAQANVISTALKKAHVNPRTISFLEAHGTGTSLGDPIELTGLMSAYGEYTKDKEYCSIGSAKSNIGHLESAAGIASLTKVLLMMKYRELVPSIHSEILNPNIEFHESPFRIQHSNEPWERPLIEMHGRKSEYPLRAAISAFGAGGSNAHIIIEEYTHHESRKSVSEGSCVVLLSAADREQLRECAHLLLNELEVDVLTLSDIAYTLQIGRESLEVRLAIVVDSSGGLSDKLRDWLNEETVGDGVHFGSTAVISDPDLLLNDSNADKRYMRDLVKEGNLDRLAAFWVSGAEIDWGLLYEGTEQNPRRVSLPTYPFKRERYWVPSEEGSNVAFGLRSRLHELLDENVSTLGAQCYHKNLTGEEYYMCDHVVGGERMLPGVVYIEMARLAGDLAGEGNRVVRIEDVVWMRPVQLRDGKVDVYVSLYPDEGEIEYEVTTGGKEAAERQLHGHGKLVYGEVHEEVERLDISAIKGRCQKRMAKEECYRFFNSRGLVYGPSFQSIQELYYHKGEVLGVLELPKTLAGGLGEYILHPSLMDGALQSIMGFMVEGGDGSIYVPYSVREVRILRSLSARCYAYGRKEENGKVGEQRFSIDVLDENGVVLVQLREFLIRPIMMPFQIGLSDDEKIRSLLQELEQGRVGIQDAKSIILSSM
jgi:polyketide synthase PksN